MNDGGVLGKRVTGRVAVVLSVLMVLGGVAATASAQSASPSTGKVTFIYGDTSEPSSLNPMTGYLGTDYTIWALEYNLPIEFSVKDFTPDYQHSITTSVDTASDNMTFTYHIRPDMQWSDGQPFTAEDVAWTLNYYKENATSNYYNDLARFESAEATNPTTLVIHSTAPTTVFDGQGTTFLYEYILPKHVFEPISGDYFKAKHYNDLPTVGSGPWVVTEYKQGDLVRMERNPNYWGEQIGLHPQVDEIIYKIFNDENQEAAALQAGEIDFGYFDSSTLLNSLKDRPNIAVKAGHVPLFSELAFNTGSDIQKPEGEFVPHGNPIHAVTDPAFRRAIREAVDSSVIVDKVWSGYALPAQSPVQPTATTGSWEPPPDQALPFDLDKAKADLAAAGYKDTDGDGTVNDPVTHENVVLRYFVQTDDQTTINAAPFVKNWLEQIGVGTDVRPVDSSKLNEIILAGEYDMFHWGWYPNPDPNYILGNYVCAQRPPDGVHYGNDDSYFCNAKYDKLFAKQTEVTSFQERADIVHQMQDLFWWQMPYVMLTFDPLLDAYRTDRFTGYLAQPAGTGDLLATWGPFSFINLRPVSATAGTTKAAGGIPAGVWIAIVIGIVVIVGGVILLRRRGSEEDRA